jgi:SAM-dependent methyltransferase
MLRLGHRVIGVERSPRLAAAAAGAGVPVLLTDAAALPLSDASTDLVVACMSLLDVDDFAATVREIGRVLRPGGVLCAAVVHPFASARDENSLHSAEFRVSAPYLEQRRYTDRVERDGLGMTFISMHRPLGAYTAALFGSGMMISALTEDGGGPVPWLLALRAEKAR